MAARARSQAFHDQTQDSPEAHEPPDRAVIGPVTGANASIMSPALQLQHALEAEFAAPAVERWPRVVGVGFTLVTCGLFWGLLLLVFSPL